MYATSFSVSSVLSGRTVVQVGETEDKVDPVRGQTSVQTQ